MPAVRSASDIRTDKKMADIPAAMAISLSCCFSRIKPVAMLRMMKDNAAVQAKYDMPTIFTNIVLDFRIDRSMVEKG